MCLLVTIQSYLPDISALDFLKIFFHEIMLGRRDYENLLPMTIDVKFSKILKLILILTFFIAEPSLDGFIVGYVIFRC